MHVSTSRANPRALALSSKGDLLAVGCDNGHILLLDAASGALKQSLFGLGTHILSLAFACQDSTVAALSYDKIKVWEVKTDSFRHILHGSGAPNSGAWPLDTTPVFYAFNPNFNATPGGSVGVPGGWGVAEVWDLDSGQVRRLPPSASDMTDLAFSSKSSLLAFGRNDGVVELRQAPDGSFLSQLHDHQNQISALQFSPDGRMLAVGCRDGTMAAWDLASTNLVRRLQGDGVEVAHLAFAKNGEILITATSGFHWEENHAQQAAVTVSAISTLTWKPVWQWRSVREQPRGLKPDHIPIVGLVVDSRRVIVQTSTGALILLDLSTGQACQVKADSSPAYWSPEVEHLLSLTPDGARLASIDPQTKIVKIIRTEDLAEMLAIPPLGGRVTSVAWSSDGTKLALIGVGETGKDIEILNVLPSQLRNRSVATLAGQSPSR